MMYIVCFSSVPNVKQVHVADHGTRGGRHIQLVQRRAHAVIICQGLIQINVLLSFLHSSFSQSKHGYAGGSLCDQ